MTNQIHQPLPKRKRVDKMGNDRRRIFFKEGNSSMLLCKGVTENAFKVIKNNLEDCCYKLNTKLEGHLIWV